MTLSTLAKKLNIKPAESIEYDGVYLFARTAEQVAEAAPLALAAARFDGSFWSAWPKDNAKRKQNLTRDTGREPLYQAGLTPVTSVSINEGWSSLRYAVRRFPRLASCLYGSN